MKMSNKFFLNSDLFLRGIFLLSVFVVLLIGGFTYRHISNLTDSTKIVVSTYKFDIELEQIMSYIKDAESGHRNYIVTKDTLYLNPYFNAREKVNNSFAQLKELTIENNNQRKNLLILNKLIDNLFSNFSKTYVFVENNKTKNEAFKTLFFEEKIIMDSIRNQVNEMTDIENKLLNDRQKKYQNNLQFTPLFFYLVLLVTLILMVIAYNKISNDFKNIKAMNNQLLIFKAAATQLEVTGKHGNWIWHVNTNEFEFSDNLYRILGEVPKSFNPTLENLMKFVHRDDKEKLSKEMATMMREKELPFIYFRIVKKDGTIIHVKGHGKLLCTNDSEVRLMGNLTDISDEIESFLVLEERNLELEQNNKELSDFNYVASHDLQEPLRKIQTFISRLEEKEGQKFSDSGLQYLERIKISATRMRLLIDDLLQFSRTNKPDKAFVLANLNEILENAKQDVAEIISEKKAKITNDDLPTIPVISFQIQQLFSNLLHNSLKYSKKSMAPVIEINYSKVEAKNEPYLIKATKPNYHKLTFTDNGIGFDQKYAQRIFGLFDRLHNKQDYSGTGIGLSICKKIMDNHKGFIFAQGKVNEGSVFVLYLPVC